MENNAQWYINPDGWYPYCSRCGAEPKNGETTKYCPTCGAPMDAKAEPSAVILDEDIVNHVNGLISMSLKELEALPGSYYKDHIRNRLISVATIITEGEK